MATLKSIKNKYLTASDGAVLGVTTNTENIAALSFKLATADSLSKFNLVDGFADDYNDATGVSSGDSTNDTRDATGKYYSGSSAVAGSTGFTVTGALQTFTVPTGVTSLDIKCFATGEANAGGYATGTLATSASTVYAVVVGEREAAGSPGSYNPYGYGGGGRAKAYPSGSGLTGVFTGSSDITFTSTSDQARAIIIAGGSGGRGGQGGAIRGDGGGASGGTGIYSGTPGGTGGTQSAVGTGYSSGANGTVMQGGQGGSNNEDGGAGGGYYGGGGSSGAPASGGGSGYVGTQNSLTSGLTYAGASSEKTSDADYPGSEIAKVLFKYNTAAYANMTLQSNAFTAQADPTTARIILDQASGAGSTTLDTDLKAYASRDNGTTFTQMPLFDQGNLIIQNQGGIDSNTKLMLHCDGANDGTTFTDNSDSPHTVTAVGSVHTDTAVKKFGTASAQFDGAGDQLTVPSSSDWNPYDISFTADFWLYVSSFNDDYDWILGNSGVNYGGWNIQLEKSNTTINFLVGDGSSWTINTAGGNGYAISTGTWYHIALVKNGTAWALYVDGTSRLTGTSASHSYNNTLQVGLSTLWPDAGNSGPREFDGYVDEIRISNIARWTAAFTPPTVPYTTGAAVAVTRRLVSGSVDISGQPAGSNVKYKLTTHNQSVSKITRVYGTSMAWA